MKSGERSAQWRGVAEVSTARKKSLSGGRKLEKRGGDAVLNYDMNTHKSALGLWAIRCKSRSLSWRCPARSTSWLSNSARALKTLTLTLQAVVNTYLLFFFLATILSMYYFFKFLSACEQ